MSLATIYEAAERKHIDKQADRLPVKDRQTHREIDRYIKRLIDTLRDRDRQIDKHREKDTNIQINRQTARHKVYFFMLRQRQTVSH